jgi:REP element-mobilizing transposase RayT
MNRGRRRGRIFSCADDYDMFTAVLQEAVEMWNLQVAAYCLMSNHYHLLVHTPDGNISRSMRHINGVYTQRYNRVHKREGQLFRGRYKALIVDGDSYLLEVLRYIHRNPIRAGLVENLDDFDRSSHQGYLSRAKKWNWLYKDFILSVFSADPRQARKAYSSFVSRQEPKEIERFYSKKNLSSVLGDDDFKDWVRLKFQHLRLHPEIPESRILAPLPENILSVVSSHFKVSANCFQSSRRGFENIPRDIAIYLMRMHRQDTLTDVGKYFNIKNYSTVSSAFERVKNRIKNDKKFHRLIDKLENKLHKSQQ